ncbi:hypothetical protein MLD38_032774 [Melastoma candidum]|nr:hypothetical protein MLD38_032774 [Melastoma candidum]
MPVRTVVTVNCVVSGLIRNDGFEDAVVLVNGLLDGRFGNGLRPNYVTFVSLIGGCRGIGDGRVAGECFHCYCLKGSFMAAKEVGNALVDMYGKFGGLADAEKVFGEMLNRDLVSWNTMMGVYARGNKLEEARGLFRLMRTMDVGCDRVSLINLALAFVNDGRFGFGRMIHGFVKVKGIDTVGALGALLIGMYSRVGSIEYCRKVFEELPDYDLASVNAMIHAYVESGLNLEAFDLFRVIKDENMQPDEMTMLGLIAACRNSGDSHCGDNVSFSISQCVHLRGSIVLQNALIDMYSKCGEMAKARSLFDKMPVKDVVSWTSIIMGHALNGEGKETIAAFQQMVQENVRPNSITFVGVLLACSHAGLVEEGQKLFNAMCSEYHIQPTIEHLGCMVDMYARAGLQEEARDFAREMPAESSGVVRRMLIASGRAYGDLDSGLKLHNRVTKNKTVNVAEDCVATCNLLAEAGRWDDVLMERGLMSAQKVSKRPGRSSVTVSA